MRRTAETVIEARFDSERDCGEARGATANPYFKGFRMIGARKTLRLKRGPVAWF